GRGTTSARSTARRSIRIATSSARSPRRLAPRSSRSSGPQATARSRPRSRWPGRSTTPSRTTSSTSRRTRWATADSAAPASPAPSGSGPLSNEASAWLQSLRGVSTMWGIATRRGAHEVEERFLHEIISTVGSSLNLEEVLDGVVRLLSDASAVHACFVYLLDRDQKRLVLRAASAPYSHLAGRIELKRGDGLAWWALNRREAAFIRDSALDDPRVKYVPELEEERFQSLVAVPLLGKRGDPIGAITLDTEAPREFTDAAVAHCGSRSRSSRARNCSERSSRTARASSIWPARRRTRRPSRSRRSRCSSGSPRRT